MNQPTDLFGATLADIATRATRQALQSDPALRARLAQLQGNTVELQCTLPPATWHLYIEDGSVLTRAGTAAAPQAIVRGNLLDLASWLLPGGNSPTLEVSGDNTLLLELADILKSFSPDLADPLSNVLGTELAGNVVGAAEMGLKTLQSLLQGAGQTIRQQATRSFVQQPQLEDFLNGVDDLRLRIDRLAARISEAEQRAAQRGSAAK